MLCLKLNDLYWKANSPILAARPFTVMVTTGLATDAVRLGAEVAAGAGEVAPRVDANRRATPGRLLSEALSQRTPARVERLPSRMYQPSPTRVLSMIPRVLQTKICRARRLSEHVFEHAIVVAVHAERRVDRLGADVGRVDIQTEAA
jgi:hypothetical protein